MRGADTFTDSLFIMRRLDDFVWADHPLRHVRTMVNVALKNFEPMRSSMYAADVKGARPSIAPEKLLRAMLLQIFYSIRSERMLMEQTQYNLLYHWFIGLSMDDSVWVPTVFTKNRERLIELFNEVLAIANKNGWLSGKHFSVDGTLIQAWAGHKSFVRKDGNDGDSANFNGQSRSNDTHESSIDADAKQVALEQAQITRGADKGYDAAEFIAEKRKLIEQGAGWAKLVDPIRQVMVRGLKKLDQLFVLTMAAYDLTRMRTLGQVRLQMAQ
ncbi:MAG: transposase [Burkholderiales bacterium]|nr:transposase [Burkholderiales bacterium]